MIFTFSFNRYTLCKLLVYKNPKRSLCEKWVALAKSSFESFELLLGVNGSKGRRKIVYFVQYGCKSKAGFGKNTE